MVYSMCNVDDSLVMENYRHSAVYRLHIHGSSGLVTEFEQTA